MQIDALFQRDIHRKINGVVKADQVDESSVWQELDEFVVTRELNGHLHDLVAALLSAINSEPDAAGRNGVWVSGFFGCGKSHFIKVLSYLLENHEHAHRGETRHAVDFFVDKLDDPMLLADLKKVTSANTETILFNIDSKADHRHGRDALLQVFLKVLNEKRGFSPDDPHIAALESHLEEKGKLEAFHSAFERKAGSPWLQERDSYDFYRDAVVSACEEALGLSKESAEEWVDRGEETFTLTVENFAKSVKRYLDRRGPDSRILFLVDEVGQFIGNDTHLMLNLQTVTEQLGTICDGRAWVVVTSQEDLDAVLGDVSRSRQQDFSKIQGRFKTRLTLSGANVDEVIKERLLLKNDRAREPLAEAYEGKEDILKNQLSFLNAGTSFKNYIDQEDFSACYPFAAYQFSLVQKVFSSIRKAGATGQHLAEGERSALDAFQSAAVKIGDSEVDALVPFYEFYPAVEGFLDTAVKRTIDQAKDNHDLDSFDPTLLQVLFLIRYVEELPGNVDNLVTLCVDEIDCDRLALRRKIEGSLGRLETQTLVARNGDFYFFLTNEERDIGREIKNEAVASGAEERELGRILFEDILDDARKHTYSETGRDFAYTRICDDHVIGNKVEGSLEVSVTSPLGDRYAELADDAACVLHTATEQGRILVRLPDDPTLGRELRAYLQTDAYVRTKNTSALPETTKRILRDRSDDNRARRKQIIASLKTLFAEASYFATGKKLDIARAGPRDAVAEALEYQIRNAYPKMRYIRHLQKDPKQEIQSILRADDIEQVTLGLEAEEANPEALDDLREYIRLCAATSRQIVLYELIEQRYGQRPYGWPELEVVLLVARLAVLREIHLTVEAAPLPLDKAYDQLTKPTGQRKVVIKQRESAATDLIQKAQALGQALFAQQGPGAEEALFVFLKENLDAWNADLKEYEPLASTGNYPGKQEIESSVSVLAKFVDESNSLRFLTRFVENEADLKDLEEDLQELRGFYRDQKHTWEALQKAVRDLEPNRLQLGAEEEASQAMARMAEILKIPRPYRLLSEVAALIHTATSANDALVVKAREPVVAEVQDLLKSVRSELEKVAAPDALSQKATGELEALLKQVARDMSIAHIAQARTTAGDAFDRALTVIETGIEQAQASPKPGSEGAAPSPPPPQKRQVVDAKTLVSGGFIETPEDMEAFIQKLRGELEAALKAGKRIQIK